MARELPLSANEQTVMKHLRATPGLTNAEISDRLHQQTGTMVVILRVMVTRGLIREADGRFELATTLTGGT